MIRAACMIDIEHSANVFGRIAAIGAAYGIDLTRLLDRSTPLTPELADLAVVGVPHTFDRIQVLAQIDKNGMPRALAECDPEQARRVEALASADTRAAVIELSTIPADRERVAVAFQVLGRRVLATDLARLASFGELPIETARAVATALGAADHLVGVTDRGDGTWTLQIEQSNATPTQRAATRERVDRAAALLGVTRAQRDMVAGLHDVLAKDRDSYALVHVRKERVALAVMWGVVPWEHVVRMMMQFYRGGVARQLGELAGATGGETAAMVEIVLGTSEPPAMRVAAAIAKGRT
jgi:hypothetical protein